VLALPPSLRRTIIVVVRGFAFLRQRRVGVAAATGSTAILIAALAPFQHKVGLLNEGLLFLLLTLLISSTWGWQVGLFAAVLSNLALNFFFVPPLHRLIVHGPTNVFALFVFLLVSLVGGSLLSTARAAARQARRRQAETEVLLSLSRTMIGRTEPRDALIALCQEVVQAFDARGAAVLSGADGSWTLLAFAGADSAGRQPDVEERAMAGRAVAEGMSVMLGETGLSTRRRPRIVRPRVPVLRAEEPPRSIAFVPLRVGGRTLGVLRLDGPIGETPFRDHPDRLLAAFASEAALALQRVELAQAAAHADALMQADKMKSALLASISHDLKTPLAGIKTGVSSLLDRSVNWSPEDVQAFLETIDSQADRLNRVISDVLDLNRIEAGAVTPMPRTVRARDLLEEARDRTASVTAGRNVCVDVPIEVRVLTDESLILQALVNLVENAARYSTPGGSIRLNGSARGSVVELSVEDDGPGIAPEDIPHVFERFYRAAEQGRRVKGSGLGLAIVKGFVEVCGGSVRVESSAAGTRFVVALPLAGQTALSA
jgi:two-component system sensor histidine kinase KdpD